MSLENDKDKKLGNFLKNNQPVPPLRKENEEHKILAAIQENNGRSDSFGIKYWWAPASVIAASFVIGIGIFSSLLREPSPN